MFAELLVVDDAESLLMYMLKLKVQPDIWAPLKRLSKSSSAAGGILIHRGRT